MNSVLGHGFTLNSNPAASRPFADWTTLTWRARRTLGAVRLRREAIEPVITIAWALSPLAVALIALIAA